MTTAADQPPKSKRRWFRYSLRTLFVVVTLIAVFLGLVVRRAAEQKRIVAELERMGAECIYDFEDEAARHDWGVGPSVHSPPWLREWIGKDVVANVTWVEMAGPNSITQGRKDRRVVDASAALSLARCLPKIHTLRLFSIEMSDEMLRQIGSMTKLRQLYIMVDGSIEKGTMLNVSDAGLNHLKSLTQLEVICLNYYPRVTDAGLASLSHLKSLQYVDLSGTSVTGTGLRRLEALPSIEGVVLDGCPVNVEEFRKLSKEYPNCRFSSSGVAEIEFK